MTGDVRVVLFVRLRDVSQVTYHDNIKEIDGFEMTVNNWDATTGTFNAESASTATVNGAITSVSASACQSGKRRRRGWGGARRTKAQARCACLGQIKPR